MKNDDTNFLSSDHPSNMDRRMMWPDIDKHKRTAYNNGFTFGWLFGFFAGVCAGFLVFVVGLGF